MAAERTKLENIVSEGKEIASKLIAGSATYLSKYPQPVNRWIFGSHTNQPEAKKFEALGNNFLKLGDHVSEAEVITFLISTYNKLDTLSNGELKKMLTSDDLIESKTISILAKILNLTVESVTLDVNLSNSGIGGKSISTYLSIAQESAKEKEMEMT